MPELNTKRINEIQQIIEDLRNAEYTGKPRNNLHSDARYALLELLDKVKGPRETYPSK